ncbi:MAG TPA: glycosyl transferase, partial [Streptosporangiaceae bacterium]|nr:glycosyl transferase [Streptosporangiaceae bacterium]
MSVSSAAEAVGQRTAPERSADRLVPRWADCTAVALFLALAFWVTSGLWIHVGSLALVNGGSDITFFEWTLVHAARLFTHGENPLFTPQMNAPNGVNLMANTGLLGLTVPLVPVTLLFGPAVAFTIMLTGGLAATGWAWYHVLSRHIVGYWPAALVGGLFAGFAPGMVSHVNGHPDLVNQFLIPFIVWRVISMRSVRDGVVLGLLVTWQAFLNEELLLQTGLAVAIFVVVYAVFRPAEVRARVRPFLTGLGPALLTAGALLAYPLWFQFFGPQSYRGLPETVLGYGTDVRAFAAFSESSLVRHGVSHSSYGGPPEENTFFGAPLLIAVGLIVVWLWRRHVAVRALTVVALVFAVLSLGRTVRVGGHTVLQHGPMSLLDHLQLFDSVVPTRFGLALIPVIAILLAFSVDAAATASHAWLRYGWTLVLVAALLPIAPWPVPAERAAPVPGFFTSGQWHQYVPDD